MKYKVFKERVSLYDYLVQTNPYFYGLYQVCKIQCVIFLIYLVFRDSYKEGRLWLDLSRHAELIGDMPGLLVLLALEIWMLFIFILLYPMFLLWKLLQQMMGVVSDLLYFLLLCGYVVLSFFSLYKAYSMEMMGGIPRVVAAAECLRLFMKTISFTYENVYKVRHPWRKDDEQGPAVWYGGQMSPKVASFSQYMYFLVAPTLIYRDHYPRNKGGIKWKNVVAYFIQLVVLCLVAKAVLEVQFPKSFKMDDLAEMMMMMILTSPLMYFLVSIIILHTYFNMTAELTRFADREFYLNWWSAWGYTEYYKIWNTPIYDFTSFYIYGITKSYVPRAVAGVMVLTCSAVVHDFIAGVGYQLFIPAFIVLYALIGGVMFTIGAKFPKYYLILNNCFGYFLFQGAYFLEFGARYYCPDPSLSYFTIHTPYCFQQHNNVTLPFWL